MKYTLAFLIVFILPAVASRPNLFSNVSSLDNGLCFSECGNFKDDSSTTWKVVNKCKSGYKCSLTKNDGKSCENPGTAFKGDCIEDNSCTAHCVNNLLGELDNSPGYSWHFSPNCKEGYTCAYTDKVQPGSCDNHVGPDIVELGCKKLDKKPSPSKTSSGFSLSGSGVF
jgi:hypothetical protein